MKKVSANCYRGRLIKNPIEICKLALQRKSIYTCNWGVKPAAILLSMQFRIIIDLIDRKLLFAVINKSKD